MDGWREQASGLLHCLAEVAAETLYPTRCALCDKPGKVICERCESVLPHVDWWRACRRCGSPYGFVQCDACNPLALERIGRECLPYDACASAFEFTDATGRLVRVFKDQGERRLASFMAKQMAAILPPAWPFDAISFVPATLAAYRHRGFDHAGLIACELAALLGVECVELLERPRTRDQRRLAAAQRIANLAGSFHALKDARIPARVLLIDDVYTTGATLCAASDALAAAGTKEIRCLSFARV